MFEVMAMEGECTDVGFLVLFLLFQALLELTVFLETVLLGHLTLLILCLHDTTLMTEILQLTVEDLVFAEFTLQRTIVERNLDAWLQTDLFEALLTVGEYPGIIVEELVFQTFPNHLIGTQQVGRGDTFAVGWVGDDDALVLRLYEILEVLLLNGDGIR